MGLEKYHQKRDFKQTSEPKGRVHKKGNYLFVIQKHAARRLHYDFRIELDGVLKSWAVPKGPAFDPTVKRLAIHVEDHPIEYGKFEGVIPKGEYGGGTVLMWDTGTWEPLDEKPLEAYKKGHLRFLLHAKKLKGRWDLIRFKSEDSSNSWFLIKYEDEYAQSLKNYDITKREPNSVVSGESMEEITHNYQATWTRKEGLKKSAKYQKVDLELPPAAFPGFIRPQLATLVDKAPEGEEWCHEIKLDGYRILAFKQGKKVKLLSRNNKDWTAKFKNIEAELQKLPVSNLVLDGEIVLLDEKNRSDFQLLQNSLKSDKQCALIYYVFDILYYENWDVRNFALRERKKLLQPLLENAPLSIRYSDYITGHGKEFFESSCQFALEGIVSKKLGSKYTSKRSTSWLKVKCIHRQEFVIAGFSPPKGARPCFGSLYLGTYNSEGEFIYSGKVGTGFTQQSLKTLYSKMKGLVVDKNPFKIKPPDIKTATWIKPKLIAEVEFTEWTDDGRLRHPSFKGLREDKKPKQVKKEVEKPTQKIEKKKPSAKVKLTNLKKILYSEDKITKGDILEYYIEISPFILPFIKNRPLTLVRCPSHYQKCFFQKHMNASTVKTLLPFPIESNRAKKIEDYLYLTDINGLIGLVQMGVLEIHPWGSTITNIELPDMITFDIDPSPELAWQQTVEAALELKKSLQGLNLRSFVKSTGGKGLHVVVPIQPRHDWEVIKKFAQLLVEFIERQHPKQYVTTMSKAKRTGKIFLDYLRNQRNATAIAAYSTRARIHAPVATPLHWDELTYNKKDVIYNIYTLPKRLASLKEDPWRDFWSIQQELNI